jgi:hypothetical protein
MRKKLRQKENEVQSCTVKEKISRKNDTLMGTVLRVGFTAFIGKSSIVSKYHFICFLHVVTLILSFIKMFSTAYKVQSKLSFRLDLFI